MEPSFLAEGLDMGLGHVLELRLCQTASSFPRVAWLTVRGVGILVTSRLGLLAQCEGLVDAKLGCNSLAFSWSHKQGLEV